MTVPVVVGSSELKCHRLIIEPRTGYSGKSSHASDGDPAGEGTSHASSIAPCYGECMSFTKARRACLVVLALLAVGGCATLQNQLSITTVDGCIKHNCKSSEAHAYQSCEASCRDTYGR